MVMVRVGSYFSLMPQKTFSEPIKYCVLNEIPYIVVLRFSVWLGLIKDIDFNRTQTCTCKLLVLQKSMALQNRFQYEAQVESCVSLGVKSTLNVPLLLRV